MFDSQGNFLFHGQDWRNHKYIRKEGDKYIYPEDIKTPQQASRASGGSGGTHSGYGSGGSHVDRKVVAPSAPNPARTARIATRDVKTTPRASKGAEYINRIASKAGMPSNIGKANKKAIRNPVAREEYVTNNSKGVKKRKIEDGKTSNKPVGDTNKGKNKMTFHDDTYANIADSIERYYTKIPALDLVNEYDKKINGNGMPSDIRRKRAREQFNKDTDKAKNNQMDKYTELGNAAILIQEMKYNGGFKDPKKFKETIKSFKKAYKEFYGEEMSDKDVTNLLNKYKNSKNIKKESEKLSEDMVKVAIGDTAQYYSDVSRWDKTLSDENKIKRNKYNIRNSATAQSEKKKGESKLDKRSVQSGQVSAGSYGKAYVSKKSKKHLDGSTDKQYERTTSGGASTAQNEMKKGLTAIKKKKEEEKDKARYNKMRSYYYGKK